MKITEVRVLTCDVPLSRPVVLGEVKYASRDYVVVEIRTDEGYSGVGFGMARYAPVAQIVERNLAPLLIGEDPLMTERLWERMYYSNLFIGQRGIFMRALSAVDIALWDIKGKVAGLPVWRLLGGHRTRLPVLMAGGYVVPGKKVADLTAELADYASRGFRLVKIAGGDITEDTARLVASRRAVGPAVKLMYDAHSSWREVTAIAATVRRWDELDLAWIEDPFPSELGALTARLRQQTHIPFAIGEEFVGRWAFQLLFKENLADVARVDVTTVGGFTEAVKICALAATDGLPVSPHIFPELHVHLAAALPQVIAVEVTDPPQEIDVLYRLLRRPLPITDGEVVAPDEPGLGIEIDWSAAERYRH
jgi:L-alanine-DL-glutamate epimerase-like enolase superfamily enzyme